MSNKLPRRALIAVTSYNEVFYDDGKKTGLYYTEALHPYEELEKAGFEVDLASETGTFGMDEHSVTKDVLTAEEAKVLHDKNNPFTKKLDNLKKVSDIKAADYGMFFASAGHATLYDYPKARGLQSFAEDVWQRGGVVAAVCHGPIILPGIKDKSTGDSIIKGKSITGFTDKGERDMGIMKKLEKEGIVTIEGAAKGAGATYKSPATPFADFSIKDGRLVTGANPASAKSTAEKAIEVFDEQNN